MNHTVIENARSMLSDANFPNIGQKLITQQLYLINGPLATATQKTPYEK